MPADSVLSGLLLLFSFCMSHCSVSVPGTEWVEPAIIWIVISMPTGSGKTPLYNFLTSILRQVRSKLKKETSHQWLLDEASFEKMGDLMATNNAKLLGLYDELSSFWAQINVYRGKGLCESHDLSTFLSLYTGKSWTRATGMYHLGQWSCCSTGHVYVVVSGDANFTMDKTALTVGGFTQPSVSRSVIELPASVDKGFAQRFLWIFPEPSFSDFDSLEPVDETFSSYIGEYTVLISIC